MRRKILVFFLFISLNIYSHQLEKKNILENSRIRIIHTSVAEVSVILKKVNGTEKPFTKIYYDLICKNGEVSLKTFYYYYFQKPQIVNVQINQNEYIDLWKTAYRIGLDELSALPLDSAIDPFEFIDSWRTEKDTFQIEFKSKEKTVRFLLYDIGAYRDRRFNTLIDKIVNFFDEKNESAFSGRKK